MATNYVQEGSVIAVATPSGGVVSGQGLMIGNMFCVASADYAEGATGQYMTKGVFTLPKKSTDTIDPLQVVYWNATDKITETKTSGYRVGVSLETSGNGKTTCIVRLDGIASIQEASS